MPARILTMQYYKHLFCFRWCTGQLSVPIISRLGSYSEYSLHKELSLHVGLDVNYVVNPVNLLHSDGCMTHVIHMNVLYVIFKIKKLHYLLIYKTNKMKCSYCLDVKCCKQLNLHFIKNIVY